MPYDSPVFPSNRWGRSQSGFRGHSKFTGAVDLCVVHRIFAQAYLPFVNAVAHRSRDAYDSNPGRLF
jgi:hypothetical protein